MLWIIGLTVVAVVALIVVTKIWARSADDFWGTIQERANERDTVVAEQKARAREEKKRLALERSERAKAAALGEELVEPEPEPPASFVELPGDQALTLIAERSDLTILDVRTPGETMAGIIEGSTLMPMDQVPGRAGELPEGPVLVYCAMGQRSAAVCDFLVQQGRKEVFNLAGGIMGWQGKVVRPVH